MLDQEYGIQVDKNNAGVGSPAWCFYQMDHIKLINQCKQSVIELLKKVSVCNVNTCQSCGGIDFVVDTKRCHTICTQCGLTGMYDADVTTRSDKTTYNRPCRHHYTALEHFSQTLCDFARIGDRTTPPDVFQFVYTVLGTGDSVTSARVFETLRLNKYRAYYQHKYTIASQLRDTPEYRVEGNDVYELRRLYRLIHLRIYNFQERHNIGKRNKRGKLRIYWPMRYILARLCELINRPDLVPFIRGISGKERLDVYNQFWDLLIAETNKGQREGYGARHVQQSIPPMVALGRACSMTWE